MITKLATRLLPLLLIAAAIAVPADAFAAISESASSSWWDEILIGVAAIGGLILIDTSSWSLMTGR